MVPQNDMLGQQVMDMGGIMGQAIPLRNMSTFANQNYGGEIPEAKSGIYIKPSKRGTFTAAAKKHGKSVQGFAGQVLSHKENYSPAMVKKANFARNASKWHHAYGGEIDGRPFMYPFQLGKGMSGTNPTNYTQGFTMNYGGMSQDDFRSLGGMSDEDGDVDYVKKGGWIKKAVNPKHKGYCTPMTKSTCTPRRKAFAMTMKKHHGFHDKGGGVIYPFGHNDQEENTNWFQDRGGIIYPFGRTEGEDNQLWFKDRGGVIYPFGHFDGPENELWFKDRGGVIYPFSNMRMGGTQNLIGNITNPEYHPRQAKPNVNFYKKGGKTHGGGPNTDLNPTTNHSIAEYNPYIYFKNKKWYMTTNPEDMGVTQSMKPVDEDVANIEAEKGELLVKPDLMGLYNITGKKHSQGGTPLYAEGGSFIFSNDPKLAISKHERDVFGFKQGGSTSKSHNTPAKVLNREIRPKDYNAYIATLQEPGSDKIAKTTAALMLEKMQSKIGQVAYLQETKKNKPVPQFAMGSAPVQQGQFNDIEEKMDEYAYGGSYPDGGPFDPNNPFLPRLFSGNPSFGFPKTLDQGYADPTKPNFPGAYTRSKTARGRVTPSGMSSLFNQAPNLGSYPGGLLGWSGNDEDSDPGHGIGLVPDWEGVGIDARKYKTQGEFQGAMYDWALKNNPQLLRNMWKQYGINNKGKRLGFGKLDMNNLSDQDLQNLKESYDDNMLGARVFQPKRPEQDVTLPLFPNGQLNLAPPQEGPNQPTVANPNQPFGSIPSLPYDIKGKLTPMQLADLSFRGLQSMNINRYYPKRSQVNLPEISLNQINAQPMVNAINNQTFQAYQAANLNPRTASLIGSNLRGAASDQISGVLGNVANQNIIIGNEQNRINLGQKTQQVMANAQLDQDYYNKVQATNQNFDDEKRFANNQFFSTLNQYQSQDDALAWQLAAQSRYGNRKVRDPKTGRIYNQPTPLFEYTPNGIRYNADVADINMARNAEKLNSIPEIAQSMQELMSRGISENAARSIIINIIRAGTSKGGVGQGPFFMNQPYGD